MSGAISREASMAAYNTERSGPTESKAKVTAGIATAITFVAAIVGSIAIGILTGGIGFGVAAGIGGVLLASGAGALFSKIASIFDGAKPVNQS